MDIIHSFSADADRYAWLQASTRLTDDLDAHAQASALSVRAFSSAMDVVYDSVARWDGYFAYVPQDLRESQGDVLLWRNARVGGNAEVLGSQLVQHDLFVKGWLVAPNIWGLSNLIGPIREIYESAPIEVRLDYDDPFMAFGQTKRVTCRLFKGWSDLSGKVDRWTVERDSGDSADDLVWGASPKARAFNGVIDICWNEETDDIGLACSARFIFTAFLQDGLRLSGSLTI